MSSNKQEQPKVHAMVRQLVDIEDVPVHVCGTHAEWYGVTPEEFPDYVDVASAISGANPGNAEFFGDSDQIFVNQNFAFRVDLFEGETAFKPFHNLCHDLFILIGQ